MPNAIALITKYLADTLALNQVFKFASLTSDLEVPNAVPVSSKTVRMPKIVFGNTDLDDYSRSEGFKVKDFSLIWDDYTLTQEKGNALKLDKMDAEESGQDVVKFVNAYIRTIVVPAVDKYRFTAMKAKGKQVKIEKPTSANALKLLDAATEFFVEKEVGNENTILYCTPAFHTCMKQSEEVRRNIVMGNWNGVLDREVKMFGQAKIIEVPSSRFPAGVEFMLVKKESVLGVVKHNAAEFHEKVPGFRGHQIDYDMYHDCWVVSNKADGVYIGQTTDVDNVAPEENK